MSNIISAIILGVVQGLGEFLPISSSGHLILIRAALKIEDQGLAFDVALHFGTLLAVLWYFRRQGTLFLQDLGKQLLNANKAPRGKNLRLLVCIALATVPGAAAGFFLEDWAEHIFRYPKSVAMMLAVYALFLAVADRYNRRRKSGTQSIGDITYGKSILIGIAQALAIIPGTSRSGATITAGLFLGLSRKDAAVFSFMLSIPIIFGAFLSSARHIFAVENIDVPMLFGGITSSAIVGFLSIKYMLQYLTNHNYDLFVWYRIVLAMVIFILNLKF